MPCFSSPLSAPWPYTFLHSDLSSASHLSASDATEDHHNFNKWAATINDAAEDKNNHLGKEDKADAQAWHHRWWDMVEDRNMGSPEDKATIAHWMDFREDGKKKLWGKATAAAEPLWLAQHKHPKILNITLP